MDLYSRLGVTPAINAAGTLTDYGGSLMSPEVLAAMAEAAQSFVPIRELHAEAGRYLAGMLGVEAAHICGCASAGIALMAAACMAGSDLERIRRLPDSAGMRRFFVVQKAHRNQFDQAVRVAGGQFVEVEARPEKLAQAIGADTAGVYYTSAWFCTGAALPLPQVAEIAHQAGVPVIVDAAAELPPADNLTRFIRQGADLVAFSGGKMLRGPQSSGLILGRKDLIEACRANDSPNMSIGRSMKAGKEEIAGLVRAVELYLEKDHAAEMRDWEQRVGTIVEALSSIPGVSVRRGLPGGVGQRIPHAALTWDARALGLSYTELQQRLLAGEPRIIVQLIAPEAYDLSNFPEPEIRIHPHTLKEGEECVVARRVREELTGKRG
ncbi:MAG: aminotransferase class V-fold PLP-dependent enzyme [Chloroflexi bacterium]|nr:aminotransferase class V-fold PLP-dependent enzyme [Chloroflexota bacterium]